MNTRRLTRREMLGTSIASSAVLASVASSPLAQAAVSPEPAIPTGGLRYCLNTSTINHSKVPIREQIQIAEEAGYDSIEIWIGDVTKFLESGGTLKELAKEISDRGLQVDSAIAFGNWIVDDDAKRQAGLEQCKKDMEIVSQLGGTRIAAPPSGATREAGLDLRAAADRYHALLDVGAAAGVIPQLELWGFSKNVSTLEEVLFIAAAAQHPDSCILLDVYHMYKGGCDFSNVDLVPVQKMHCLHMNDYPDIPRDQIGDADRVFPGDGIAPLSKILSTFISNGFTGALSLELFNREYWKRPAAEVARVGLEKMKAAVTEATS